MQQNNPQPSPSNDNNSHLKHLVTDGVMFFVRFGITMACFIGGAWFCYMYVGRISDSAIALLIGIALLPFAFVMSILASGGIAFASSVLQGMRKQKTPTDSSEQEIERNSQTIVVPVCILISIVGGLLIGALTENMSPVGGGVRFGLIGLAYGAVLWLLLRADLIETPL